MSQQQFYIMKNLLTTAFFLALLAGQSFAQKTLPTDMEPHAAGLSYTVKKMLKAAGYRLPGAEVGSKVKQGVESGRRGGVF